MFKSDVGATRDPELLIRPISIRLSSTFNVSVLISVVVPVTNKLPPIVTFPLVATAAAFNVPVKVGFAEKTTEPVPVSSVKAAAS